MHHIFHKDLIVHNFLFKYTVLFFVAKKLLFKGQFKSDFSFF